jgi:hypothetical protein
MSDYLANLVAKSRNLANAVQPRPASPFEPASPGATPIDDRGVGEVEGAMDVRIPRGTSFDHPLATSTPFERSSDTRLPRIGVGPAGGAVQPWSGGIANDDTRQHPETMAGSPSMTPVPRPVILRDASVVPPPGSTGALAQSRSPEHVESVLTPRTERLQTATVISGERGATTIRPAPPDRSAPASAQDAVPTIKISIGRVDVRAVMPSSPAPRPASPRRSPALSLNDYLKHQDERKR